MKLKLYNANQISEHFLFSLHFDENIYLKEKYFWGAFFMKKKPFTEKNSDCGIIQFTNMHKDYLTCCLQE